MNHKNNNKKEKVVFFAKIFKIYSFFIRSYHKKAVNLQLNKRNHKNPLVKIKNRTNIK